MQACRRYAVFLLAVVPRIIRIFNPALFLHAANGAVQRPRRQMQPPAGQSFHILHDAIPMQRFC